MAQKYFEHFPFLGYSIDTTGELRVATDIMQRARIRQSLEANGLIFYEYDVQDGETPEIIAEIQGHLVVRDLFRAVRRVREAALRGDVGYFISAVEAGDLGAPFAQWVRILPTAAREQLLAWVAAGLADAKGCYSACYHGGEAEADGPGQVRRLTEYEGPISELVMGYLVRPALLRELLEAVFNALMSYKRFIQAETLIFPTLRNHPTAS